MLPTALLNWKSPFEILYHKPPTLTQLRVFGCLCYEANVYPTKHKFEPRVSKCIFLGYSQSQKTYKVYDIHCNIMFTSRDVVFHENTFPFKNIPTEPDPIPLPLPISEPTTDDTLEIPTTPTMFLASSDHISPLPPSHPPPPLTLRKSHRQSPKPTWMADYVCHCTFLASAHCTPSSFAPPHISSVAQLSSKQEPRTYLQASKDEKWIAAMQQEIQALERSGTWEITTLPIGKRVISSRWVFKLKLNPNGSIERYKARLVAKGYIQIEGVEYFDSFSPIAKSVSTRVFLAVATAKGWPVLQLDANFGYLERSLYGSSS
ncbi:UNVERIFIED_CONTAM: Retrovirus-related Pol polyprotein from transposon RE1 [Sesamum latifolium]|uniref:Retrovirus-related Pol polyprotein from transposon RE1 n=1 Tax=Sesamum latifolium TaxID=2727402 RepID=A0AAW2YAT5_9LAMI